MLLLSSFFFSFLFSFFGYGMGNGHLVSFCLMFSSQIHYWFGIYIDYSCIFIVFLGCNEFILDVCFVGFVYILVSHELSNREFLEFRLNYILKHEIPG